MTLAEIMKSTGIDQNKDSIAMLRHFPEECGVILKSYRDGDVIFRENDPIAHVGILVQGRYSCVWDISGRDDYEHISEKLPAMLGDQAAMAKLPRYTGTFRAFGPCKVALMRLPDFWLWMERDPAFYRDTVATHICKLISQCRTRRSTVVDSSDIRVIKYLVWYCQANGHTFDSQQPRPMTVRITREAMTGAIGQISLRTVNRILSQLEGEGRIGIVRGKVQIRPQQYRDLLETLKSYTSGV